MSLCAPAVPSPSPPHLSLPPPFSLSYRHQQYSNLPVHTAVLQEHGKRGVPTATTFSLNVCPSIPISSRLNTRHPIPIPLSPSAFAVPTVVYNHSSSSSASSGPTPSPLANTLISSLPQKAIDRPAAPTTHGCDRTPTLQDQKSA